MASCTSYGDSLLVDDFDDFMNCGILIKSDQCWEVWWSGEHALCFFLYCLPTWNFRWKQEHWVYTYLLGYM